MEKITMIQLPVSALGPEVDAAYQERELLSARAQRLADVALRAYRSIIGAVAADERWGDLLRRFNAETIAAQRDLAERAFHGELGIGVLFPGKRGLIRVIPCSPKGEEFLETLSSGTFTIFRDNEEEYVWHRQYYRILPLDGGDAPSGSSNLNPRYDFLAVDLDLVGATDEEYAELWRKLYRGMYVWECQMLFPKGFEPPLTTGDLLQVGGPYQAVYLPTGALAMLGHASGENEGQEWNWLPGVAESPLWDPRKEDAEKELRPLRPEEVEFLRNLSGEKSPLDRDDLWSLQDALLHLEEEKKVNG